jgi:hypothetical protein
MGAKQRDGKTDEPGVQEPKPTVIEKHEPAVLVEKEKPKKSPAKPIRITNNSLQVQVVTLRAASGKLTEVTIPSKSSVVWDSKENLGGAFEAKRRSGILSLSC